MDKSDNEKTRVTLYMTEDEKYEATAFAAQRHKSLTKLLKELLQREMQNQSGRRVREQNAPYATAGQ
jgi:hypothetical protein